MVPGILSSEPRGHARASGFDDFTIQMPGRVAEYRQDRGQPNQKQGCTRGQKHDDANDARRESIHLLSPLAEFADASSENSGPNSSGNSGTTRRSRGC